MVLLYAAYIRHNLLNSVCRRTKRVSRFASRRQRGHLRVDKSYARHRHPRPCARQSRRRSEPSALESDGGNILRIKVQDACRKT